MTGHPADTDIGNPPGLPRLRRRATDHARALRRMRAVLGDGDRDRAVRAAARHGPDDPAVALLDAWAVVSDTVAFYTERIAHEGLLRTAVQPGSVRELARTVGYQPDPGAAAEVQLAFTVDTGPLTPEVVTVPAGTPVQSVPAESTMAGPPGPAALPQTFETLADLRARAGWNALQAYPERWQPGTGGRSIRLRGAVPVEPGDPVLFSGPDPKTPPVLRLVTSAVSDPIHPGWTVLTVAEAVPADADAVVTFAHRARLFGWNAPDPNLLVTDPSRPPTGIEVDVSKRRRKKGPPWRWKNYGVETGLLELDGEFPAVLPGSWVVLQQGGHTEGYAVDSAVQTGKAAFAVAGRITQVTTTAGVLPSKPPTSGSFERRGAVVYCGAVVHDATWAPADAVADGVVHVPPFEPAFEKGHEVLLTWDAAGKPRAVPAAVVALAKGDRYTLTLAGSVSGVPLANLLIRGNVVRAGHGETVRQVLGSGDGSAGFQTFRLRRGPLTFVAAGSGEGSRPELTVRVDDVEWRRVPDLGGAGPADRVYTVLVDEDGTASIGFGDGVTGARLPTGTDNVVAVHRVGLGHGGEVAAGRITQLPRRPLGIRDVTNPAPTVGAEPPEDMSQARVNAPRRVRILDRAVSLADHERYAAGFPGVGAARADLVWDGRQNRIVVSVRTTGVTDPDEPMLRRLGDALADARDPLLRLDVLPATALWFTATVEVRRDPAWPWKRVEADVRAALDDAYGPWRVPFAATVSDTELLSLVEKRPGVLGCRRPLLSLVVDGVTAGRGVPVLEAAVAGWDLGSHEPVAAQVLALAGPELLSVVEVG